ncbi:MAG: ATP-binding protein [Pseudomonadota bacterium]
MNILKRLTIFHKLLLLSGIPIIFMFVLGAVFYTNLAYQKTVIDEIVNNKLSNLLQVSSMSRNILTLHNELARVVRWSALGYMTQDEIKQTLTQQLQTLEQLENQLWQTFSNASNEKQQKIKSLLAEYKEWLSQIQEVITVDKSLVDIYLGSADENIVFIINFLKTMEKQVADEGQQYFTASSQHFTRSIIIFIIIFSLSIITAIIVAYFFGNSIIKPINYLASKVTYISTHRDLSQQIEVHNKDEIWILAKAFNAMIKSLKDFYDQLDELNKNLELKVIQRTSEISLTNKKLEDEIGERKKTELALMQAKKEADKANKAKSVFLSNMSHELRTPLNGILGYTQVLQRDDSLTHDQQNRINVIHQSGEHLLKLINDVLDLAKIESGKMELLSTDFDLMFFLQGIVTLFRQRTDEKGLKFNFEVSDNLPAGVHTDETRLRQIFFNLLSNAVKFTDTGTISLIVDHHDHRLQVQIIDEGCGIASEQLDKVLQPFQQTGSQLHKAQGTGLGLPITKHMIESVMEGNLKITSELGKGSCFSFEIGAPAVENIEQSSFRNQTDFIGYKGEKICILIVDDKEQNRGVLCELLKPLGFEIREACDGVEGLEMAKKYHPQLILMDLVMPNMDGFECTKILRSMPEFDDTALFAVSASVLQHQTKQALNSGCDVFIPKPIRAESLFLEMSHFLKIQWIYKQQVTQEPATQEKIDEPAEMIGPEGKQAIKLHKLASIGDIEEILDHLELLENESKLKPFVQHARQLVKNYQVEKLEKFVKEFL